MVSLTDRLDGIVGGKAATLLDEVFGIRTVDALLRHYPRKYSQGMTVRGEDDAPPEEGEHITFVDVIDEATVRWTNRQPRREYLVITLRYTRPKVTATFALQTFALSVSKSGAGSGTVTSSPAGIDCGATCGASYDYGSVVTLSASPAVGSTFTGWSGSGCSGTGSCQVTMSAARNVTANFALQSLALSVTKLGAGSGTVTSSPLGISCGATCAASFSYGTVVTLAAPASFGSVFAGWGGACSGTGSCQVTMDAAKSVTASFQLQSFPLTVTKAGSGSGTVSSSPAGVKTEHFAAFAS